MLKFFLASAIILLNSYSWAGPSLIADRVVVKKADKKLFLVKNGVPIQEYTIALGPKPKGHKREEGDERTPEGSYILDFKNADSDFYKSIHISYPNQRDKQLAAINGVDPGGSIMIHGLPNTSTIDPALAQRYNWTDGCIAVTNNEMDEIWHAVEAGTPIDILP